jgi:hypothetical protein
LNTLVNFQSAQPSKTGQFSIGVNTQDQQQALVQRLQAKCASFGFRYGTDGMANCVSQQHAALAAGDASQPQIDWFKKSQCYSTGRLDC